MMKEYEISIEQLNAEGLGYIRKLFDTDSICSLDDLLRYMIALDECRITILENEEANDASAEIIDCLENALEYNSSISLIYDMGIREVTVDIDQLNLGKHEYLKSIFAFPDYYGNNLDALYDCLSEQEKTWIRIINLADVNEFSINVLSVFDDVADEYGNITIIYEHDDDEQIDD